MAVNLGVQRRANWRDTTSVSAYASPVKRQLDAGHARQFNPQTKQITFQPSTVRSSVNFDSAASAGAGILGAASIAAPALVPFAAAAGIGYGVYKLGESFKLW